LAYDVYLENLQLIEQSNIDIELYETYTYNAKRSWISYAEPKVVVTSYDNNGTENLSSASVQIDAEIIPLFDSTGYTFGKPVLIQNEKYNWKIKVVEEYTNIDTDVDYVYNVPNSVLTIKNNCSNQPETLKDTINSAGYSKYSFSGGDPNLMENIVSAEESYCQSIDISAKTPKGESVQWQPDGEAYRAYVLGQKILGKNFYTEGPDLVEFILRDPPGSSSYASLEAGSSITTTISSYTSDGHIEEDVDFYTLGLDLTWDVAIPFVGAKGFNVDITADLYDGEVDMKLTESGNSTTITTSYSKTISTSDEPYYTGANGDVYIGKSTNQFYGRGQLITIFKDGVVTDYNELDANGGAYFIGKKDKDINGIELSTNFAYSQNHILNYLIPELERKRKNYCNDHPEWYTLNPDNTSDQPTYLSSNDDPRFDLDSETFDIFDGQSYKFDTSLVTVEEGKHILDYDKVLFYSQQINLWKEKLALNEWEKMLAKEYDMRGDKNVSFDAGSSYESCEFLSVDSSSWTNIIIERSEYSNKAYGVQFCGLGYIRYDNWTDLGANDQGESSTDLDETSKDTTTVITYHLSDDDQRDYYSVNIDKCVSGHGPVFTMLGGQSSCPYEPGYAVQYEEFLPLDTVTGKFEEEYFDSISHTTLVGMYPKFKNGYILSEDPLKIEDPVISCAQTAISDVSPNEAAEFDVTVGNLTDHVEKVWLTMRVEPSSNPYGAVVEVDGHTINNGMSLMLQGGQSMLKKVKVYKGSDEVDEYENLKILLHTDCAYDPTDDVADPESFIELTANFTPCNSPVNLKSPTENWIVNKSNDDTLLLRVNEYKLTNKYFDKLVLQYKTKTQSDNEYLSFMTYFNSDKFSVVDTLQTEIEKEYYDYRSAKGLIDGDNSISYKWGVGDLVDGEYTIRAVTIGKKGNEEILASSEVAIGLIDTQAPRMFGTPQPADGILSVGDNISIAFSEAINQKMLTDLNFSVRGTLNKSALKHGTGLQFNTETSVNFEGELPINNSPYSIEFWINPASTATGTLLSYTTASQLFSINVESGLLKVYLEGEPYTYMPLEADTWTHCSVSFDLTKMYMYKNGVQVSTEPCAAILEKGQLILGKGYEGKMHDLRVWSAYRSSASVYADMSQTLSPLEKDLVGYWPMDEARGEMIHDKVSVRTGNLSSGAWFLSPSGKSMFFDGAQYASFDATRIPLSEEADYTMEFWMQASNAAHSSTIAVGDQNTDRTTLNDLFSVRINETGQLFAGAGSDSLITDSIVCDNQWHHIALLVDRENNAVLYVDGTENDNVEGVEFAHILTSEFVLGALNTRGGDSANPYLGYLDEFRIWQGVRTKTQLEDCRYKRLSDVTGLLAYFPFEDYSGSPAQITSSFTDMSVDKWASEPSNHVGDLESDALPSFSDLTPAIKIESTESELMYNIVVKEDEVVIIPLADKVRMENVLLTIVADGVEDLNGNKLETPVEWTAYVKQNTILWGEDEVAMELDPNVSAMTTLAVNNSGGSSQRFTIDNVPGWLRVSPVTGVVEPGESFNISCEILPGLSVGEHQQSLYLSSDYGFSEKLDLSLWIKSQKPDWTVHLGNYENTMTIIGQLKIDGEWSTDENDMVALFNDEVCQGVANMEYFAARDFYYVNLTAYGRPNDDLHLRVWDDSEGNIYTDVTPDVSFAVNGFLGSPASPVEIATSDSIAGSIPLINGWNWLSFNLNSSQLINSDKLFSSIQSAENDQVKYTDAYDDNVDALGWGNTMIFEVDKMYKLNTSFADTIRLSGVPVRTSSEPVSISSRWNWIGFTPQYKMTVASALAYHSPQEGDILKSQTQFAMYSEMMGWIGSLKYMQPFEGYMYYSENSSNVNFKYPQETLFNKSASISTEVEVEKGDDKIAYEYNMTAMLTVSDQALVSQSYLRLMDRTWLEKLKLPLLMEWHYFQ
jgi:hypothetical protein